jgi:hypothetical protein
MEGTKPKWRWFRYSLRSMLVLWTIAAVAIGWYTHRQRIIRVERAKLVGSWDMNIRSDALNAVLNSIELSQLDFQVGVPDGDVGTIDFPGSGAGPSKGIYRIDRDSLIIATNGVGKPRPTTFVDAEMFWEAKRVGPPSDRSQAETKSP